MVNLQEFWADIPGFEGYYKISSLGRVKSLKRVGHSKDKIMKSWISVYGYVLIHLCKNDVRTSLRVHRIVADLFVPNPENKPIVNHKDTDKTNNDFSNLEWCTNLENLIHSFENKTRPTGYLGFRFIRPKGLAVGSPEYLADKEQQYQKFLKGFKSIAKREYWKPG